MQHGQRTQNSPTNKAPGRRTQALLAYEVDANDDMAAATKIAARRAAEAAFAPSQVRSSPPPSAQVIVRRTRAASLAVKLTPAGNDSPTIDRTAKGARVFRVDAPPTSRSAEAGFAALPSPTEASTHNGSLPAQAPATPKARRIATDKRPGPVLHVIHAPPERKHEVEAPRPRLDLLIDELERVTPVLDMIVRAQAFSLVDERFDREWLRLSRKVDRLHAQIRAQLR